MKNILYSLLSILLLVSCKTTPENTKVVGEIFGTTYVTQMPCEIAHVMQTRKGIVWILLGI